MIFVDSNVLVFASVRESPFHAAARKAIQDILDEDEGWISRQVIREYLATLTRPQPYAMQLRGSDAVHRILFVASGMRVAEEGAMVTRCLYEFLDRLPIGGAQVHDANIVATMQVHGIRRLLTGNVRDFDRFAHLIEVVPLV